MRDSWRPYLQIRAPRYTSYPSALRFNDGVDAGAFADKLAGIGPYEPVSLYVHVPFCRRMCWYCGCTMRVENNYARVRRYVDALCEEIRAVGDVLSGRGRPIGVHFGGGTPNILHNEDLARVLQAVEESIGLTDDARLAIELDPRLLENGDAAALRTLGFTRISLGVQDFDRHVQEAINRVQSFELVEACVSDMRVAGVDDLSIDILYGLPKQTERTFLRTLDKVVALSPDRVSVFGYAHLPSVLANQRMIVDADLPDDALRGELAEMADGALLRAGYVRVGFDHYAKPDNGLAVAVRERRLRRNFQGFTEDAAEAVIGFGASAVSFVGGLYAQNHKTVGGYEAAVAARRLATERGAVRTPYDEVVARTITDLLCRFEVDVSDLLAQAPGGDVARIDAALEDFQATGVVDREGARLRLNPDAYGLARAVAMALDPYAHGQQSFAKAV